MTTPPPTPPHAPSRHGHEPHAHTTPQIVYLWISAIFVTSLLMANVLGVKLFQIDTGITGILPDGKPVRIIHTVGMIPFPLTFVLTDLLNEFYGRRATRRVTYIAFTMAVLAFLMISVGRAMPILEGTPGTATNETFEAIFGASSLMYIASVCAFLVGSLLDISLFAIFHHFTGERMIWFRATGSTVVSQVFDSFVVTFLFFAAFPAILHTGNPPQSLRWVIEFAATGYVLKFVIAILVTPVIYLGRWWMMHGLGMRPAVVGSRAEAR